MKPLDRKAADLQDVINEIIRQFRSVNAAAAVGPHAELNMQELHVIEFLGTQGPQMMREVSAFLDVAVNTVTSIVDGLEKKNQIRRQRSSEDRRVIRVELTETGRTTFQMSRDFHLRFLRTMLGALTEDEQEIFMVLFRKVARAGRSEVQQLTIVSEQQ